MKEGEELEHPWLNRSIECAQKKVEQQNYSIRKRLLQYDDVLNQQREVVYGIRNAAIHAERPKDIIFEQIEEELLNRLEVAGFGEKGGADADRGRKPRRLAQRAFSDQPPRGRTDRQRSGRARRDVAARAHQAGLRGEGVGRDSRGARLARALRRHQRHRPPLAGAPHRDGGPAQEHRPAQLRPEGPARGIQGRGLQLFRGADEQRAAADLHRPVPQRVESRELREHARAAQPHRARGRPDGRSAGRPPQITTTATRPAARVPRRPSRKSSCPRSRCAARRRRSAATTPAPAAAARNTRTATAPFPCLAFFFFFFFEGGGVDLVFFNFLFFPAKEDNRGSEEAPPPEMSTT